MFQKLWKKEEVTEEIAMTSEKAKQSVKSIDNSSISQQFYKHPKILLIDIKDDAEKILKVAGFNVESGTLGTPYRVKQSKGYTPSAITFDLPNYEEQEILIFDLCPEKILDKTLENTITEGDNGFWGQCNLGVIDPRPVAITTSRSAFEKIIRRNGVFIIFADNNPFTNLVWAVDTRYSGFLVHQSNLDIWSFLETLNASNFQTTASSGSEMKVQRPDTSLGRFLNKYINNATFTCTTNPTEITSYGGNIIGYSNRSVDSWKVTAINKYNEPVAGVFVPDKEYDGWIFIFPQITDKASFLLEFIRDVLPEFAPTLFPYTDNKNWIQRSEYQTITVEKLNASIVEIENEAKQKVETIKKEIEEEKAKIEYQNKLLTDDGDSLVKAVEQTFKVLGFTNVLNVDEEYEKQGKTNSNDEDLQIRDKPTSLLIEVKGVAGFPSDDDSRQVTKHIPIRMKEWQEFDVKALSVINHQKAIPALDREKKPFRPLIVESAEEQYLGLMTTFELYRLVRSFLKNGWKHENIKDLFIQSGRISIIPAHYEYVGIIEHYWENVGVVGIRVEENAVNRGDTISFELPIEFEEMNVDSLQVENASVEIAESSMLAGIKTDLPKEVLRKGIRVFRVRTV